MYFTEVAGRDRSVGVFYGSQTAQTVEIAVVEWEMNLNVQGGVEGEQHVGGGVIAVEAVVNARCGWFAGWMMWAVAWQMQNDE